MGSKWRKFEVGSRPSSDKLSHGHRFTHFAALNLLKQFVGGTLIPGENRIEGTSTCVLLVVTIDHTRSSVEDQLLRLRFSF